MQEKDIVSCSDKEIAGYTSDVMTHEHIRPFLELLRNHTVLRLLQKYKNIMLDNT